MDPLISCNGVNDRKLKKYSNNFNKMFEFYFRITRTGLITFCGDIVKVDFDVNGSDGKFSFREYDNGRFKNTIPVSRHPNILKSVLIGKKGWGLLIRNWSEGIGSGLFTKFEFFELMKEYNIQIPDSFIIEFNNAVSKERIKRESDQKLNFDMLYKIYKNRIVE